MDAEIASFCLVQGRGQGGRPNLRGIEWPAAIVDDRDQPRAVAPQFDGNFQLIVADVAVHDGMGDRVPMLFAAVHGSGFAQSGGFPMSASTPLLEPNRTSRIYEYTALALAMMACNALGGR